MSTTAVETQDNAPKRGKERRRRKRAPNAATLAVETQGGDRTLLLGGEWTMRGLADIDNRIRALPADKGRTVMDLANVTRFDTAGAWLVDRFKSRVESNGGSVALVNVAPEQASLIDAIDKLDLYEAASDEDDRSLLVRLFGYFTGNISNMFVSVGRSMEELYTDTKTGLLVIGASLMGEESSKSGRRKFGITPIVAQLDHMVVKALPIIGLMSFLIGAIIAQQGAFQLRYVAGPGSEIFAVDLTGILLLREIAVMLTAIMVAGRTGSAITAELGSMRMREEIDALKVIGLNPISALVFPRLVALGIALPVLTIFSSACALLGGGIVLYYYADLSFQAQITELRAAIDFTTMLAGILKAPFMALIIGVVASLEGLQVEGSAESLGRRVTASVVKSIFLVIFIDGLFAIYYAQIDF